MSEMISIDEQYKNWISDVSHRFKQSQIKAATQVNSEMLRFYWSLGKDLSKMVSVPSYGRGLYKQISMDLKRKLPNIKSFSETNLRYMQYFYEMYASEISPQAGDDFGILPQVGENSISDRP